MTEILEVDAATGAAVLKLSGSLCISDAARFIVVARQAAAAQSVTLRCAEVERVDGSALQILIALAASLRRDNRTFRLADASPALESALALCGLGPDLAKGKD